MLVGNEQAYRAVAARDSRFDGAFVHGVRSTGIYCRPSCPARTPKHANSEFFPTAAAAQAAGYRACRRCLPDAVPGSPEWDLRSDLAGRAMRLINDGVLDRMGVAGLAAELGYSSRQLTRVLSAELGAGPLGLARTHRAHTARVLTETTTLPFTDVAFAAGFASLRQFNATFREVFAGAPSELRQRARSRETPSTAGEIHLRLPFRQPFELAGMFEFLRARALPGVEAAGVDQGRDGAARRHYTRALRLSHGAGVATVRPAEEHLACTLWLADLRDLGSAVSRLRRLFDLDSDPQAVIGALAADPALAPSIADLPGIRVPGSVDGAELLIRTVLGQQVSVRSALSAASGLVTALGDPLPGGNWDAPGVTRLFPTARALAESSREVLTGPRRRAETVRAVAAELAAGTLQVHPGCSAERLRAQLCAIPGIGPWTADYVAMRVLGLPDVLLTGDRALRRGAGELGLPTEPAALLQRAERWRPWRSYAGALLWRVSTSEREASTCTGTR